MEFNFAKRLRPALVRRAQSGFSLVEMLAATLILVLLSGLVASGVATAVSIYRQEQFVSQAQVLSDSLNSTISVPFRFMIESAKSADDNRYVINYNGENIYWDADNVSAEDLPFLGVDEERGIFVFRGKSEDGQSISRPLLNERVYDTCRVSMQNVEVSYEEGQVTDTSLVTGVAGVYKVIDKTDPSREKTFSFCFHPLGEKYKIDTMS